MFPRASHTTALVAALIAFSSLACFKRTITQTRYELADYAPADAGGNTCYQLCRVEARSCGAIRRDKAGKVCAVNDTLCAPSWCGQEWDACLARCAKFHEGAHTPTRTTEKKITGRFLLP